MEKKQEKMKMFIDIAMLASLLFLMAYQITGDLFHEWIGIGMTALAIVHQILNRKWYGSLFKGKRSPYRILSMVINVFLILSFFVTALCGMSMSSHAAPFLYGILQLSFARRMHLSLSHWSFVLMGLHLGMHLPLILAKLKFGKKQKIFDAVFVLIAAIGFILCLRNKIFDYLFFKAAFAFFDYDKAAILVFVENLLILLSWTFFGYALARLCQSKQQGTFHDGK
ncbi:MAG: DUF4405 domain-containing protein [Erysipelotrichaceae bacterium]|nr:DUF4405 domain-containing protein [Erysipelotrichaceae bacterium]MBQ5444021.1 DUF4405 domain-containing protein [Erysipelotrichaceae bacterium]